MALDPKLIEIARSAEAGRTLSPLKLSTPAQLIVGVPGPSSGFVEATWTSIMDEQRQRIRRDKGGFPSQKKAGAVEQRLEAEASPLREAWGPVVVAPEPDPPETLTVYDAIVWAWGEHSGLRVPAVRVRIDSISAWWAGNAVQIKGSSGGGWFAFVGLPINLGN